MAENWIEIDLSAKLFLNLDEDALTRAQAALENAFQTEAGGISRFPGLADFVDLDDHGRAYLGEWRGSLMAATSNGRLYRVDREGSVEDVTGVPISGGGRVIFTPTESELILSAGGPLVRFAGERTELLSEDAPNATHTGYIDSYVLAPERFSNRWNHSNAGAAREWDVLDTFTADSKPDPVLALLVTPFREILFAGKETIEQWERLQSGDVPFFRRWSVGEGIFGPYTLMFADNGVIALNEDKEIVRISGQTAEPLGTDVAKVLQEIDDWTDAWMGGFPDKPLNILGQNFVILQAPNATNPYGTKGYTIALDYRQRKFFTLYGWNTLQGVPARWPAWSHWPLWGRMFVGGDGKISEISRTAYTNNGVTQRMLLRTAHIDDLGHVAVDNARIRVKRGVGSYESEPVFSVRCNKDNRGFGPWKRIGLGKTGETMLVKEIGGFGTARTWQWEFACSDDAAIEFGKFEIQAERVGH